MPTASPSRRFIIDCDPGVDDAFAMLIAISEASLNNDEILAVTTTHGNVGLQQVVKNACKVLDILNVKNQFFDSKKIPIYPGAARPLIRNEREYVQWHGADGLGDANLPEAEETMKNVREDHAALALVRLVSKYPGEVSLIALGPHTNIALACHLDQTFISKVKELIWMGGTTLAKGNVSLTGEHNIHKDPEAAHIVLSSFPHSTMVSWELTENHTVDWIILEDFLDRAEQSCSRLGGFLRGISKPFVRDRDRWEGALICDAIAMAVAMKPEICTESRLRFVDVELEGKYTRGQTVIDWEGQLKERHTPNVKIVDRIDMDEFNSMLMRVLDHAGGSTGKDS